MQLNNNKYKINIYTGDSARDDKTNTPPHLEHRLKSDIVLGLFGDWTFQWGQFQIGHSVEVGIRLRLELAT